MKITNKNKRGFTLVELIVVIAIVAILAAVSVVSYMAFINQANVSNDTQIVKELNTILQGDEALHGPRDTYHEVLEVVGDNGFLVEKLTPRTNGYRIVYDRAHNRFALLNEHDDPVYQDTGSRQYKYVLGEVWNIVNKGETLSDKFANYLGESYEITELNIPIKTGLDVGKHTERLNITYIGQTTHQHAIVRTMGGTFVVNNGNDDVTHYGLSTEVTVTDVKAGTYKEFGTVGRLHYEDEVGKIAIGNKDDNAIFCYMNESADSTANKANIAAENAKVYTWVDYGTGVAAGFAHDVAEHAVTVTENQVSVATCHNHNGKNNYELIRIGDLQYIICKSCGGFALYEGDDPTPKAASEEIDTSGEPFDYNPVNLNTTYGFYDSKQEGGTWIHEIKTKAHFKNIMAHIDAWKNYSQDPNLANENTYYHILNDINFGGTLWTSESTVINNTFRGHLVGIKEGENSRVVLSNIVSNSTKMFYGGDTRSTGLFAIFDQILDCEIKNIELSNVKVENSTGKAVGLFAAGSAVKTNNDSKVYFENCVIDNTCSVVAAANAAAFIGEPRGNVYDLKFINCENHANVTCGSTNVGGFIGSGTSGPVDNWKITFTNCINTGRILGKYFVAGFMGCCHDGTKKTISLDNCRNDGDIYCVSGDSNSKCVGFFHGSRKTNEYITSNLVNTGHIYIAQYDTKTPSQMIEPGDDKYEIKLVDDQTLTIKDGENNVLNKTGYLSYVDYSSILLLLSGENAGDWFKNDNTLNLKNTSLDCDLVVVNIRQHGLRISKIEYWDYVKDNVVYQTNECGGPEASETHQYIDTFEYNSVAAIDIKKVTQCGYFVQSGANQPQASYNADFDTFKLDNSLLGTDGYENGYHNRGEYGYIVATNVNPDSPEYLAICSWRNEVLYEITAYKNDEIVGIGYASYGRASGDDTYLTAISL